MQLTASAIFPFDLPLHTKIVVQGQVMERRKGLLLRLTDDNGREHWGEVAPLAGVHQESLESAWNDLLQTLPRLLNVPLNIRDFCWHQSFWGLWSEESKLSPAVICGIEQVLLHLCAYYKCLPEQKVAAKMRIPVARLVNFDAVDFVRAGQLMNCNAEKPTTVKLKFGRQQMDACLDFLWEQCEQYPLLRLRIDTNRRLNEEDLLTLAQHPVVSQVEFFEEPFADINENTRAHYNFGLPIALDESLWTSTIEDAPKVSHYILKPSRLGLSQTVKWIKKVQSYGAKVVLSSCYETGLSMLSYALLFQYCIDESLAMGFGPYAFLAKDVMDPPWSINADTLEVDLQTLWNGKRKIIVDEL